MKHEHLNRPLGLELLTYLVKGKLTKYTREEQMQYLKQVKAAYDLYHGTDYARMIEKNGNIFIKLANGKTIGLKNNIEKMISTENIHYYSLYEIKFDLPNVYEFL